MYDTAADGDGTALGAAIVETPTHSQGSWQYWRYDLHRAMDSSLLAASQNQTSLQQSESIRDSLLAISIDLNVTRQDVWLSFPPNLTARRSFLLHPLDRIRFVPHPHFYWSARDAQEPKIALRAWDIRSEGRSGKNIEGNKIERKRAEEKKSMR